MTRARVRTLAGLVGSAVLILPAVASTPVTAVWHRTRCFVPAEVAAAARSAGNPRARDHRSISAQQQGRIEAQAKQRLAAHRTSASASVAVPVYVHVMTSNTGAGDVTNARIARQIDVLNQTYSGRDADHPGGADTGFRFKLVATDRFRNSTWHADRDSGAYRAHTRRGGRTALNVWLVDFDFLGVATFPWDYTSAAAVDGVRIEFKSLPGGSAGHYNEGKTLTHETGHWLGLYHTFQDGCASPGDEVSDTPAQASPSTGCPVGRNSCSSPGADPIHDYMDYSFDACYQSFTGGQVSRMKKMWTAYRD